MNNPLVNLLYIFAGVAFYAAIHHGLRAWRKPTDATGALFVPLCLLVVGYVITKAGVYQAESVIDARVQGSGVWQVALWAAIFAAFARCLGMCASAYRRSPTRSNLTLVLALLLFLLTGLGNQAVNLGRLSFVNTFEFGFVFLVAVKDIAGKYVFCNDKYLQLFQLQAVDVLGRTDSMLFSPDEARQIQRSDRQVLEQLQPQRYPQVFDHVDALRHQVWHVDRVLRTGALTASLAPRS